MTAPAARNSSPPVHTRPNPWQNASVTMRRDAVKELKRLASIERGAAPARPAACAVALVYPDSYFIGMSSMGFQLVYGALNALPGVRCERAFLMPRGESLTVEGRRPLSDFDVVAFSLSCEQDYGNAVEIIRRAGIPPFSASRDERFPLLLGGGVCVTLNPEPLADLFDLFVLGEAEEVLSPLFERLAVEARKGGRARLLRALAEVPGVYVPRLFTPRTDPGGRLAAVEPADRSLPRPSRRLVADLDRWPGLAPIVTPETDFGGRALVEVMRGCGWGCRFCVADYAYRPPRTRGREALAAAVARGMEMAGGIALFGPSLSDCPWLEEICGEVVARGGRVSVSSLRADALGDRLLRLLAEGGMRALTIAPETPSAFLQRRINKSIPPAEIASAAERAAGAGLRDLKLYYMIGIPGERDADLEAIAAGVEAAAARINVRVSVGCLVPKANTPLQWAGMEPEAELKRRYRLVHGMLSRIPRVRLSGQSVRGALVEGLLARGDRALGGFLVEGRMPEGAIGRYAMRGRETGEVFPWDHLDGGAGKGYLLAEYERFVKGEPTPRCAVRECRRCAACG